MGRRAILTAFGVWRLAFGVRRSAFGVRRLGRLGDRRQNKPDKKDLSVSGALAAFSGVILTSRLRTARPTAAQSVELDAIAAVVLRALAYSAGEAGSSAPFSP